MTADLRGVMLVAKTAGQTDTLMDTRRAELTVCSWETKTAVMKALKKAEQTVSRMAVK